MRLGLPYNLKVIWPKGVLICFANKPRPLGRLSQLPVVVAILFQLTNVVFQVVSHITINADAFQFRAAKNLGCR